MRAKPYLEAISSNGEHSLAETLQILRRSWKTIVSVTVAALCVSLIYTQLRSTVYESTAKVLVRAKTQEASQEFLNLLDMASNTKVTNELEVLHL